MTPKTKARRKQATHRFHPEVLITLLGFALVVIILWTSRGTGAIDFMAQTLTGETIQLSDYRGQVVMLNFWATWCPPCRAEMPTIEDAYEQYRAQGFTVLAINNGEGVNEIAPFAMNLGLHFPVVVDQTQELQRRFRISGYPTSIFLDANGEQYAQHSGMLSPIQLETYIQNGLARRMQPTTRP